MENQKLPVLNQGQGDLAIKVPRKRDTVLWDILKVYLLRHVMRKAPVL